MIETINELLPKNGVGLAVKLLFKISDKTLDYHVNVKTYTNEGKTIYEARIEGVTEVIQATAVESMLTSAFAIAIEAAVVTFSLPVTGTFIAIGAAVGTTIYLANNYDSQVKPVLKAIGEFESILVNAAACYDIPPEFCPDGGRYYVIDTAGITNPTSQSQFSVLTVHNDNNGKTQLSFTPGSSRIALTSQEVAQSILDYKQSSTSPNSVFFKYPQTLISLPDGKYTAMIGTNKGELLDGSFSTQPIEIYAGDGDDTLKGGAGNDHHVPGKGNDLIEDTKGHNTFYIGVDDGKDMIKANPEGELHYNGVQLKGTAKPITSKEINAPMWLIEDDTYPLILTRTKEGTPNKQGQDLTITFNENPVNVQHSVTLQEFDFTRGEQLGIDLNGSQCGPNSTEDVCVIYTSDSGDNIIYTNEGKDPSTTEIRMFGGNDFAKASNAEVGVDGGEGNDLIVCGDVNKNVPSFGEGNGGPVEVYTRHCGFQGGKDNDTFAITQNTLDKSLTVFPDNMVVFDFKLGEDKLDVSTHRITSFHNLDIKEAPGKQGRDTLITIDKEKNTQIILLGVGPKELKPEHFTFYSKEHTSPESVLSEPQIGTSNKDSLTLNKVSQSAYGLQDDDEIHVKNQGSTVFGGEGGNRVYYYKTAKSKKNKDKLEGGKLRWRRRRTIRQEDTVPRDHWRDFNVTNPGEQVVLRGYGKVKPEDISYDKASNQTLVYLPDRTLVFKGNITERLPSHIRQEGNNHNLGGGAVFAAVFFPVAVVVGGIVLTAYLCKHPEKLVVAKNKTLELGRNAKAKLIVAKDGIVWGAGKVKDGTLWGLGKTKDGLVKGGKKLWGGCTWLWNKAVEKCCGNGNQANIGNVGNQNQDMGDQFEMTTVNFDRPKDKDPNKLEEVIVDNQKNTGEYKEFQGEETPRVNEGDTIVIQENGEMFLVQNNPHEGNKQTPPLLPQKPTEFKYSEKYMKLKETKSPNTPKGNNHLVVEDSNGNIIMELGGNSPTNVIPFVLKEKPPLPTKPLRVGEVLESFLKSNVAEEHLKDNPNAKKEILEQLGKILQYKENEGSHSLLQMKIAPCFDKLVEAITLVIESKNNFNEEIREEEDNSLKENVTEALLQAVEYLNKQRVIN